MHPVVLDTLPALILPAMVLLALAVVMPFTGAREAARRSGWSRFHGLARLRGLSGQDRDLIAAWAREEMPDAPFQALLRRRDFDRFARAEVSRWGAHAGTPAQAAFVARLGALRAQLGFAGTPGPAASSHDVRPDELLELRFDAGPVVLVRALAVDEEGLTVEPRSRGRSVLPASPAWAVFSREGDGTYRFRTTPLRRHVLSHGDFLVREERRREPRAPLMADTFWVAVERLPDGFAPDDPEGVEVEALDVSSGGLALLADRDVRRGSELGIDLPLGEGAMVAGLRARVVGRGYREGGGRRAHFLHCAFVDVDPVQQRLLEEFVLEHAPG